MKPDYQGTAYSGSYESVGTRVSPSSLYDAQLADRLGLPYNDGIICFYSFVIYVANC